MKSKRSRVSTRSTKSTREVDEFDEVENVDEVDKRNYLGRRGQRGLVDYRRFCPSRHTTRYREGPRDPVCEFDEVGVADDGFESDEVG